ncbi:MAG TPA: GatB/YqeY domain-containing protein [Candidatus Limnocylindrales bacterium]|nr:GatB/YqeY domain-containing protein [Candidatus Limnocylindrales bacterium]
MTLQERLQAELTSAMRSQDALRRDTLRMAVAAAYNAEKAARRPLSEDEFVGVLAREVKTRRESVEAYRSAGREDLAAKEEAELAILAEFLPQQLSEEELRSMVLAAIDEAGATSARDLGRIMGLLAPRTRGRADGRAVSAMVAQELARRDLERHEHSEAEA